MADLIRADQLSQDLRQFTDTTQWHRWSNFFRDLSCTDGVKYLAETAQAYWLLDAIGSYQIGSVIKGSERLQEFQVWMLYVDGSKARLECLEDSGVPPVIIQEIPLTDFPLKEIKLYCANKIILLPSEY